MIKNRSTGIDVKGLFIGAFVPIIGLVCALMYPHKKEARTLLVMFFVFIGFCTLYEGTGIDTNRIAEQFLIACNHQGISFYDFYKLQPEANQVDIYMTALSWLCSHFISNPHLYLAIVVGIMGSVLATNFTFVYNRYYTKGIGHLLLILLFLVPQASFYPHRWWMAMQVFLLGALPLVYDNSYKRIYFCFLTILIHFSYVYLCVLLIAYIFSPKRNLTIYMVIFYVSLFISNFDFGSMIPYLEQVSDTQAIGRTTMYMHEYEVDSNFFSRSSKIFFNVAKAVLFLIIYLQSEWSRKNNRIFCFTLLFASFAQFASLNVVGYRFADFGNFIVVIFFIFFLATNTSRDTVRWFKYLSPVFAYYIIFQIRGILTCISLQDFLIGNYITMWFTDDNISVLNYIKNQ